MSRGVTQSGAAGSGATRETRNLLSDAELLARYVASRAAADFAEIIARHGPMVLRTCTRLTGNASDAEDAAQATFVLLSQRCTQVKEHLAGWLFKVAQDSAAQVVRTRKRRVHREEVKARMSTTFPWHRSCRCSTRRTPAH